MKNNVFLTACITLSLAAVAIVNAAPDGDNGKGKTGVVVVHRNGSDAGEGSNEVVVSVAGAIAHLGNHDEDCIPLNVNPREAVNEIADALGVSAGSLVCVSNEPE